jgi:DNA ligase-1
MEDMEGDLEMRSANNDVVSEDEDSDVEVAAATHDDVNPDIDEDGPGGRNFDPIEQASWTRGQKVPYLSLCRLFDFVSTTSSRLLITAFCADFLRSVICLSPEQLLPVIYLLTNKIAPAFVVIEIVFSSVFSSSTSCS